MCQQRYLHNVCGESIKNSLWINSISCFFLIILKFNYLILDQQQLVLINLNSSMVYQNEVGKRSQRKRDIE